jgi:flagella basal body P-ring formation protein FlgA
MLRKIARIFARSVVTLSVLQLALAQPVPVRDVISPQQIADAMSVAGIAVTPAQIEVLSGSIHAKVNATLRVVSVREQSSGAITVKLRCQNNDQCLPFYVFVHGVAGMASGTSSGVGGRVGQALITTSAQKVSALTLSGPAIVRSGDRATLILESADSHMRLPVVCLQSGAMGEMIHVSSPDHRQFFDAEVVGSGMLKGKL